MVHSRAGRLRLSTRHPALRGIAIGRCIDQSDIQDADGCALWEGTGYIHAHAHSSPLDPYPGWICLASTTDLTRTTVIHELAHIICRHRILVHGERWQRVVRELGGRVERSYR